MNYLKLVIKPAFFFPSISMYNTLLVFFLNLFNLIIIRIKSSYLSYLSRLFNLSSLILVY